MEKIKTLCRVYITDSFDNKVVFCYTLLFPALYFVYMNFKQIRQAHHYSINEISNVFQPYWAYIIFISLLNTVIVTTIVQRESGYYKEFYFIVGSKWLIFVANFIIQVAFILVELLLFTILGMVLLRSWHFSILFSSLLGGILAVIPVTLGLSILFVFRIKVQSLSVIGTLLFFVLCYIAALPSKTPLFHLMSLLNPYKYTIVLIGLSDSFVNNGNISFSSLIQLLIVTVAFCLIGLKGFSKFDIRPILDRL
ncbi:hypothetical protein [Liquorilactobacillus aquaticus]|uniref:hypothetical protein n=1 Tax=Liquorilactobacillus aquaticus TaxID=392566 RepID=UPI0007096FC5|nr:hypothetical protein [Liquorilactobacillus aquaticus]